MASEPAVTVASLLDEATAILRAAGVVKPKREANRLFAWMHRVTPGETWLTRERGTDTDVAAAFRGAVARRAAGEPIAYVLGSTGFRHLELALDRRALIPRPETEGVVDLALARVRTGHALDLCTGSGCLALALAQEGGFASVTGVDVSPDALALARDNARRTGLPVAFLEGDLTVPVAGRRFDLIVANPPYLTVAEYEALDVSVKAWEPALALLSGADGLDHSRRIVADTPPLMSPGGWLVMELDFSRSAVVAECARQAGWRHVDVTRDPFGRPRYLSAQWE